MTQPVIKPRSPSTIGEIVGKFWGADIPLILTLSIEKNMLKVDKGIPLLKLVWREENGKVHFCDVYYAYCTYMVEV